MIHSVTKEDALRHFGAVRTRGGSHGEPKDYFIRQVKEIREKLARERAMNAGSKELIAVMGEAHKNQPAEKYFEWLEGVLTFQLLYLFALEHE